MWIPSSCYGSNSNTCKPAFRNFKKILEELNINCELLISGISKKKKEDLLERLANGDIDILIGTHAIIEENVKFKKLGLVVTDEQHRFGVKQRETLAQKGTVFQDIAEEGSVGGTVQRSAQPHILVMSATPIPRTLALILYGDLDISVMDELPANRLPIKNCVVNTSYRKKAYEFIAKELLLEGRHMLFVQWLRQMRR